MRGTKSTELDYNEALDRSDTILQLAILARQALVLAAPEHSRDERAKQIMIRASEIYSRISIESLKLGEELAELADPS